MAERSRRFEARLAVAFALLAGIVAVLVAMAAGFAPGALDAVARPAPILRAALAGLAIVLGGWLLTVAVRRIDTSIRRESGAVGELSDADLGTLVRGVRLVFLAAASFTAAEPSAVSVPALPVGNSVAWTW